MNIIINNQVDSYKLSTPDYSIENNYPFEMSDLSPLIEQDTELLVQEGIDLVLQIQVGAGYKTIMISTRGMITKNDEIF